MNLLYTITAYPPSIGGAQLYAHQLAQSFAGQHPVQVASLWEANRTDWLLGTTLRAAAEPHEYHVDGIPVHCLGFSLTEKFAMLPAVLAYYPAMGVALPYLADRILPHLSPLMDGVSLIHNIRIGREPLTLASLKLARQNGIPFFFTPLHHPRWSGWLYRHYHRIYRQADALFALTQAEKSILAGLGVDERRIFVTGMGAVLAPQGDGAAFRAKYHLQSDPVVLFLGQKYLYKGIAALLQAAAIVWRKTPEAHFVFIGPRTPDSPRLFTEINNQHLLEIGPVSLQEKTDALSACTLLCVPSSQESFGGVYTEAWCLAKPVIGCRIPAVMELISEGVDGFLVDQHPEEIADRILLLLANPAQAQVMGLAGRQKVQQRYTWERLAALTGQAYQQVMDGQLA
jgi:glycosyltransferase involved in cell wall biosynthesis